MLFPAVLLAGALLACGGKEGDDTAAVTDTRQSLAQALGDQLPAGWSIACITWLWEWDEDSTFVAFDPATAELITLSSRQMGDEDWDVHGMTWDGHAAITSGSDRSVARIDLLAGTLERPDTDIGNVVAWADRLLVERGGSWAAFATWEDALADSGGEAVPELFDERFTMDGDTDYAYTMKPQGDEVKVWHVPSGGFGDMILDGFDGYVWGLSIVGDTLYLLNDGRQETGTDYNAQLYAFDKSNGTRLAKVDLGVIGHAPRGLHCEAL